MADINKTNGRMEAEIIKSYLEAEGIQVELFQEAVGRHIYPVTVDGLGRVRLFVPKARFEDPNEISTRYTKSQKGG